MADYRWNQADLAAGYDAGAAAFPSVIDRAGIILGTLEADHHDERGRPTIPARETASQARQLSLFGPDQHPLIDELRGLNVDKMTPLEAIQELARLRERVK